MSACHATRSLRNKPRAFKPETNSKYWIKVFIPLITNWKAKNCAISSGGCQIAETAATMRTKYSNPKFFIRRSHGDFHRYSVVLKLIALKSVTNGVHLFRVAHYFGLNLF